MRVKITSKLRQHDVAGLGIQHMTSTRQVIPPREQAFITRAYCPQQCTMNVSPAFCKRERNAIKHHINNISGYVETIIESEGQPKGLQLKRRTKLLTTIGL